MHITEHFNPQVDKMMKCPCCGKGDLCYEMLIVLEFARRDLGPLKLTSVARCWEYQKDLYKRQGLGTPPRNSDHVIDEDGIVRGADIPTPSGMTAQSLYNYFDDLPFSDLLALGKYSWGVHVGFRGYRARW